ncbi:MAG TPA: hypothetical protein VFW04_01450 [Gemmatimonadaceae bacterium]|nr:hypothetical protein [Gemmatimonadaceae bacterium]
MGVVEQALTVLVGRPQPLPAALVERFPELAAIRLRTGGLPPRVAGWFLGRRSVSAITLWDTVFAAPDVPLDAELLLHELAHVHQFQGSTAFPILYLWESLRRGYHDNLYEARARTFASQRVRDSRFDPPRGGGEV